MTLIHESGLSDVYVCGIHSGVWVLSKMFRPGALVSSEAARSNTGQLARRCSRKGWQCAPFQTILISVEALFAISVRDGVCVLPKSEAGPPSGVRINAITLMNDPQWVVGTELGAVVGTSVPPMSSGVDHGIKANLVMVGRGEVVDPVNDGSRIPVIAIIIIRIDCQIKL